MKHLRQLCAACVLILAIAMSTFAGNMQAGITDPPPPTPSAATTAGNMEAGSAGNMETTSITATDAVTGIALSLFQSLLTLV
jgi:hypothetical protein